MYMRLGFTHCDFTFKYYLTHLINLNDAYELVNMIIDFESCIMQTLTENDFLRNQMSTVLTAWAQSFFFNYFSYCLLLPLSASGGAIDW